MFGYRIITSVYMSDIKHKEVKRIWIERLFTFPWNPFKKTKIIQYTVPMEKILIDKIRNIIYCHPTMINKLEKQINGVSEG